MLSNVNALINRAGREATTDRAVFDTLTNRIQGLAKTRSLLTAENWSSALLRDVIEPETAGVYGDDRVTLSGPDVFVTSEATLAIGMAVHELATNTAKYGAFSSQDGHVSLNWSRITDARSDRLIIQWKETGGPQIDGPDKTGFGTQLITSTLEGSLGGTVKPEWEQNGLRVVIELDFDDVTVSKGA